MPHTPCRLAVCLLKGLVKRGSNSSRWGIVLPWLQHSWLQQQQTRLPTENRLLSSAILAVRCALQRLALMWNSVLHVGSWTRDLLLACRAADAKSSMPVLPLSVARLARIAFVF